MSTFEKIYHEFKYCSNTSLPEDELKRRSAEAARKVMETLGLK